MKNPFLIGERVYLRPIEPEDAEVMVPWMNDAEVTRTLQAPRPTTLEDERAFVERMTKSETNITLGIVTRAGDRFIGTASLMKIQWRERQACFGIAIGDKSNWGRGYGTETTRLLVDHSFDTLNLNRLWLHVYDFNAAGLRAYEKAGFRREGILRQAAYIEGAYHDVHTMAILREEWTGPVAAAGKPRALRAKHLVKRSKR